MGLGGLCGENCSDNITSSFWDVNSSRIDVSDGGTGLTTQEMQIESTFTDAGWDFSIEPIWKICETVDYPRLWWEVIDWPIIADGTT